ncbi:MAG: ABC transporter permease [Candidatus Aquicultor secundus]|uniref:ABC transporter permease n=1 Tax=Candidatus Aquicultor secundus TaxID=1973895 RepID=A0A2M7T801_9ACTN|nr:ABC transporter permease subunit [Candidatus Aquicultor secundus]NCO66685.1 ABC transporter permease subunit [Solirubrobacter sp.]OIO84263.1 MAG: ABC transporter permease [Candidatus Aquicultor secundus]PIU27959.1 MAG: ABC transporter permease [Candidatus Aquicultor secundus]PIW22377.1 MAG: ABC transporter permease [Candidatus Aquicultor secundus]PIX53165.1 MAG: ABC transporter permease [Candidatus Aquicultor secundus]
MKNMIVHELRQYQKSTIIWIIFLVAGAALYLSLFPAFSKETGTLLKVLEGYPLAFRKALGITLISFASISGFYSFVITYIILAGSIQAMILGTSIVSKEERGKTAEFLLTKPVRRSQILTAKLVAALILILITNIVYLISVPLLINAIAGATIVPKTFLLLSLALFFVQLFFLALGFLISVSASKIRSVLGVSLTTVFGFYIAGILDSLIGNTAIRYLTPFKYFDFSYIVKNGSYEIRFIILEAIILILAITTSYYVYVKRDIRSA